MLVFPCVFAKGGKVFSDDIHVSVCTDTHYVFGCVLAARYRRNIMLRYILCSIFFIIIMFEASGAGEVFIVILRDAMDGRWLNK